MSCESIERFLSVLLQINKIAELRIMHGAKVISGYYDHYRAMAQVAENWNGKASGIYTTLNPVDSALLARARNRVTASPLETTKDGEVTRRTFLPLDFDPVRPSGISSTDQEHEAALTRAQDCCMFLQKCGWPEPVVADSGNGAHLLYRIDLPNDKGSAELVKRCLQALAFRFDDEAVKVDCKVFNAGRIWKAYGTLAAKGDSTSERPHRLSKLLTLPNGLISVPIQELSQLASTMPSSDQLGRNSSVFDLGAWIREHNVSVVASGPWQDGYRYILNPCPFNDAHDNRSAFILQFKNGGIHAGCHHNSCSGKGWRDLRHIFEPDWEDKDASAVPTDFKLLSFRDFMDQPDENVSYCVDGLLPDGGMSLLCGKPKAGKSTLAHQLALAVARGTSFLGRPCIQGKVILLSHEGHKSRVKHHFMSLGATGDEPILVYCDVAPAEATKKLAGLLEQYPDTKLVIIDTAQRFLRIKDLNDYVKADSAMEPLMKIARQTGTHIVLVHHSKKGVSEDEIDSVLGSTAMSGGVDSVLLLKEKKGARLLSSRQRYGDDLPETTLAFDSQKRESSLGLTSEEAEKRIKAEKEAEKHERIRHEMETHLTLHPRLTEEELCAAVRGAGEVKKKVLAEGVGVWAGRAGRGVKGDPYVYYLISPGDPKEGCCKGDQVVEPLDLLHEALFGGTINC